MFLDIMEALLRPRCDPLNITALQWYRQVQGGPLIGPLLCMCIIFQSVLPKHACIDRAHYRNNRVTMYINKHFQGKRFSRKFYIFPLIHHFFSLRSIYKSHQYIYIPFVIKPNFSLYLGNNYW